MTEHQTVTVRLHPNDNVVTARIDLLPGTALAGEDLAAAARIPAGHKVATRPIAEGEPVRKYDQIIGFASVDIAPGEHVHTDNVEMQDFARDYAFLEDLLGEADHRMFGRAVPTIGFHTGSHDHSRHGPRPERPVHPSPFGTTTDQEKP